jgi:hypothetical protein
MERLYYGPEWAKERENKCSRQGAKTQRRAGANPDERGHATLMRNKACPLSVLSVLRGRRQWALCRRRLTLRLLTERWGDRKLGAGEELRVSLATCRNEAYQTKQALNTRPLNYGN